MLTDVQRRWLEHAVRSAFPNVSRLDDLVAEHTQTVWFHFALADDRVVITALDGRRAWVFGTAPADRAALDLRRAWHFASDVRTVIVGGPPGGYLCSGLRADDALERAWFEGQGFRERSRHVELHAMLANTSAADSRVRRARVGEREALTQWVAATFSPAWGREVGRALVAHDAVFVAGESASYAGFSAHSGNNAAVGTFGPIGVVPAARGTGIGQALARAALDDLRARGFPRATIPWVDPALVPFYRPLVADLEVIERVTLARAV